MFFNDIITYIKLKFLLLFLVVANCGFAQHPTCATVSNTVVVNGPCLSKSVQNASNSFEAPATGTYPCLASAALMDCWLKFVATASTATISIATTNTAFGPAFAVYNGPCTAGVIAGSQIGCTDNIAGNAAQTETGSLTGLTIGTTYWVRVMRTGTAATAVFTICINSKPDNDEPTSAVVLPAVTSTCSYSVGNIKNGTQTTCGGLTSPSCGSYGAGSADVWYSVNVPANGNLFIQTAGTMSMGIASYTGTPCTSLTQIGCSEGNPEGATTGPPGLYVPGLTPGTTVYIRVWNKNGATPTSFSICATNLGPCGNLSNNDFCSNPASMSPSAGTFSSSTTASPATYSYTPDQPGNMASVAACSNGYYNNSWYSFVATAATQTFGINTSATNCAGGLTAQVFSVTPNVYGCCKTFTTVGGSCLTGSTGAATLTASSLNIGSTYYIMMESNASPVQSCTYTVSGWSATGILPIDLISFYGENKDDINYVKWIISSSEKNIDSYILERSSDGVIFEKVSQVQALQNGNLSQQIYQTYDSKPYSELTYYRLRQIKLGGISNLSHIISVLGPDFYETIHNLYPNPTNTDLNFDFYSKTNNALKVQLLGYAGDVVYEIQRELDEGNNSIVVPMSSLSKGVYILKVISGKSGKTTHHKIIKN